MSERIDEIGFGGLRLIQDPDDFCYGIDAVILADHAARGVSKELLKKDGLSIADLGTGNGIVPLVLSHKIPGCQITGIEMDEGRAALAERSVLLNGLEERIGIVNRDISSLGDTFDGQFDVVTMNPPYFKKGSGMISSDPEKASRMTARHETTAGIEEFLAAAYRMLRPKGEAFLVHRPSRLADIICAGRKTHMEPKELRLVCPHEGREANICLLKFAKNGGPEMKVLPQLVVRNEDGSYTNEINIAYER